MSDTISTDNPAREEPKPAGYCRTCGKKLAETDVRLADGIIYCADHAPAVPATPITPYPVGDLGPLEPPSPWAAPAPPPSTSSSPGLAFLLGLIPGVGAIYNGQYAKGLIHVVIFGLLISIMKSGPGEMEPLFGMLMATFYLYMPFEAYHTAKKKQRGEPVDEFSGLVALRRRRPNSNLGAVILIASGVLFLLINFEVIRLYEIIRFWPVLLIAAGAYMLYSRMTEGRRTSAAEELFNERN
ncbi:MAG: hypothetical protein KIT09_05625 [Bryobacteraceae bacterium]|nr:hypothetical protein [Bryobacteraceae bacterium]